MNRRQFATVLTGLVAGTSTTQTVLEAIAGPRIPHFLLVPGLELAADDARVFEWRVYESAAALDAIFARHGIRPISKVDGRSYLIPFDTLEARHTAWGEVSGDPEWRRWRQRAPRVSQIAIYRRYPGGRIFEMSL